MAKKAKGNRVQVILECTEHKASGNLHSGECEWCGEKSDELIYTEDGQEVCIDCIEEKAFYNETLKGI